MNPFCHFFLSFLTKRDDCPVNALLCLGGPPQSPRQFSFQEIFYFICPLTFAAFFFPQSVLLLENLSQPDSPACTLSATCQPFVARTHPHPTFPTVPPPGHPTLGVKEIGRPLVLLACSTPSVHGLLLS